MAKVNVPPKKKKPSSSTAHATLEPASDGITSLDQGAESEAVSKDMQILTALPGPSTSGEGIINIPSTSASVTVLSIQEPEEPEEPATDNLAAYGTASSSMHTNTKSCKGCKHKAEYQKAMRAKKRLLSKVKSLKMEVSSLKATIGELQSVSLPPCFIFSRT